MCGESVSPVGAAGVAQGPSPRVRGIRRQPSPAQPRLGSIPACAGNPRRADDVQPLSRVHPRVCGESIRASSMVPAAAGPSPRVRGIPVGERSSGHQGGSIPACAGNPVAFRYRRGKGEVHPRVCGESVGVTGKDTEDRGPSPRVRGIQLWPALADEVGGSIPACAGNPRDGARLARLPGVHPRVCGESPRGAGVPWAQARSIPACAGNPLRPRARRRCARGPSPRVRGIRDDGSDHQAR